MTWLTTPDGTRLRYTYRGDGERTFVLVHGWKGSHRLWDQTVAGLAERHRVVAYDHRGMGESDKPRGRYDFDVLAGDLAFVLAELDLRDVTLVGWSMGCTVSLRHMERGGERVGRLVLVNGPIRLTRSDDFPHSMAPEQLEGYLRDMAESWPASEREFQAASVREPSPAVIEWMYGIALQTPLPDALQIVREQARLDMRDALENLRVPVLAAYGRHDPYYPTSLAEDIARRTPDGRHAIFEDSAHCIPFEEGARFRAVLEAFAAGEEAA
jgi:non-heme chloroperoxidase